MPIYEYGCDHCGSVLEMLQKMDELPPASCPECLQAGNMRKLVSRMSFVLEGGGWYKDGYSTVTTPPKKDGDT